MLQLVAAPPRQTPVALATSSARKTLRRAVDRNRLRRRLRETRARLRPALAALDVILRVKRVARPHEMRCRGSRGCGPAGRARGRAA